MHPEPGVASAAPRHGNVSKLLKFLGTGLLNTAFGYAVYAVLVLFKLPYLTALLLATVAGVIFNYFSFGHMVFGGRGNWRVFRKFVFAYAIIYGVNAALLAYFTKDLLLGPYVGQVLCIPFSVVLGWLMMNYWVYKKD